MCTRTLQDLTSISKDLSIQRNTHIHLTHQLPLILCQLSHRLIIPPSINLPFAPFPLPPPPLLALRSLNSDTHEVINTPTLQSSLHSLALPSQFFGDRLSSKEPTKRRDERRKEREGQHLFLHKKRKEKKRRIGKLGHKRPVGPGDANLCFIRLLFFSFSPLPLSLLLSLLCRICKQSFSRAVKGNY